jgi:hypothetical protein
MSWQPINLAVCPCCGFDVARIAPASDGFRVICDMERGGCGAEGGSAKTEPGAVGLWNNDLPSPGAVALTYAALKRAGCLL